MEKWTYSLEKWEEFLKNKYNSSQTWRCYYNQVYKFLIYINKYENELNYDDINLYLNKVVRNFSRSQQNQSISSIKTFYQEILNRKKINIKFIRSKRIEHLPTLLPKHTLIDKISKIENLKHKTIISIIYGCGLRISEMINLKLEDILYEEKRIKIVQSKGNKDRFIPISETNLNLIKNYINQYQPKIYLLNGQNSEKYSKKSIENIVKRLISPLLSTHDLRHMHATHLYEAGVDLNKIQKLLGHKDLRSTQIYTKLANNLQDIPHLI